MNTAPLCTVIMVILFAFPFFGAIADVNTQMFDMLCNTAQFTDDSLFDQALSNSIGTLTTGIVRGGVTYPFLTRSCQTDFFMRAYCMESSGTQGCIDCFIAIEKRMKKLCKNSLGVHATLYDCTLRYEAYPFDQIEEKLDVYGTCPDTTP